MSDPHYRSEDAILRDGKLAAWEYAIGVRPYRIEAGSRRRPHRGLLRDVDFDRAVPDPGHRSLLSRIGHFLWGDLRPRAMQPDAEAVELRAALTAVLGERLAAAYIGEDEAGAAAIRASIEALPRPDDASIRIDTARAA
jgi:hypothetical protein